MTRTGNSPDPTWPPVETRALWYTGDGRAEIRRELMTAPRDAVLVRTAYSGVSRGTERLVLHGRVPQSEWRRMRAPRQVGDFPGPVKYGYAAVGVVERGPQKLVGRAVFCLNPHEDVFAAEAEALLPLPDGLPPRRATLGANMETALNALWDSGAGPCDRIVVVGAGVVGLLTASLAARLPGADVTLVDVDDMRRSIAAALGIGFAMPADAPRDADVVFHTSASAAGLATALEAAGDEAVVVEMSWHGTGDVAVPLGGGFHARRLRLISSQVGRVSPGRRPRWSHARRLAAALRLLAEDDRLDALIDVEILFERAAEELPARLEPGAGGVGIVLAYS